MASQLWKSSRAADWDAQWTRYNDVLASLKARIGQHMLPVHVAHAHKLVELDAWFQHDLPTLLHERDPTPFLTQTELVQLMEWKLKKGKWRPQLMKFVESLSDAAVRSTSAAALKALAGSDSTDALKSAVQTLSELKGVGPATASAVLAAYDTKAPFMGDEALEAVAHVIGARKYTLAHYMAFAAQLTAKAAWLREQTARDDRDSRSDWSAQRVQLCLFAAAHDRSRTDVMTKSKAATATSKGVAAKSKAVVSPTTARRETRTRASSRRAAGVNKQQSDNAIAIERSENEEDAAVPLARKRRRTSAAQHQE